MTDDEYEVELARLKVETTDEPGTVVTLFEPEVVEPEVVEGEPVADWTLTHSPAERFASHLATASQAMEAAYAEARQPWQVHRQPDAGSCPNRGDQVASPRDR